MLVNDLIVRVERRHATPYELATKPILDAVLSTIALILCSPLLIGAALASYLTMGRPVLFRQTRLGRDGKPFTVFKYRTMLPDRRKESVPFAGPDRRIVHKSPHDPRITPLGRILRRTSIDELPQLVNVLRGDMSLVGPRPELPEIVDGYEPWQHLRHRVKPGITGLWQITARDSDELMHHRTDIDLKYVDRISLRTDARIMVRTVPAVLGRSLRARK